jgi:hypothetical protein
VDTIIPLLSHPLQSSTCPDVLSPSVFVADLGTCCSISTDSIFHVDPCQILLPNAFGNRQTKTGGSQSSLTEEFTAGLGRTKLKGEYTGKIHARKNNCSLKENYLPFIDMDYQTTKPWVPGHPILAKLHPSLTATYATAELSDICQSVPSRYLRGIWCTFRSLDLFQCNEVGISPFSIINY